MRTKSVQKMLQKPILKTGVHSRTSAISQHEHARPRLLHLVLPVPRPTRRVATWCLERARGTTCTSRPVTLVVRVWGCAWYGGVHGMGVCMVWGCAWYGGVHGMGVCMVWGCAWYGGVHGMGVCMVWGCAWYGGVHGMGVCMVWGCAWYGGVHGMGVCMVWGCAWYGGVHGMEACAARSRAQATLASKSKKEKRNFSSIILRLSLLRVVVTVRSGC